LNRFEAMNVFSDRTRETLHGLADRPEFQALVGKIRERNAATLMEVKARIPQALEPGCYDPTVVGRHSACSVATR